MGILSVTEVAGRSVTVDARWGRRAARKFRVTTDSKSMGPSYPLFASGVPLPGAFYLTDDEFDFGLRALEATVEQDTEDPYVFWVTVPYSSKGPDPANQTHGGGSGGSPPNDNPTEQPPTWQWGKVHDTRAVYQERAAAGQDSRAIVNSAKQPFSPRPNIDASRLSLTYTRNERSFNAAAMHAYWDCVNESTFLGFQARTVKCGSITAQNDYRNGVRFYVVTYYFEMRLDRWDLRILDAGTDVLDDNNNAVAYINPRTGQQAITLLDTHGKAWTDTANPKFLTYYAYVETDFSPLQIIVY